MKSAKQREEHNPQEYCQPGSPRKCDRQRPNDRQEQKNKQQAVSQAFASLENTMLKRIQIYYVPDIDDHEKWTHHVDSIVPKYDVVFSNDDFTLTLYQKRGIKTMKVPLKEREKFSGTYIRELIATGKNWKELVSEGTKNMLLKIDAERRLAKIL